MCSQVSEALWGSRNDFPIFLIKEVATLQTLPAHYTATQHTQPGFQRYQKPLLKRENRRERMSEADVVCHSQRHHVPGATSWVCDPRCVVNQRNGTSESRGPGCRLQGPALHLNSHVTLGTQPALLCLLPTWTGDSATLPTPPRSSEDMKD